MLTYENYVSFSLRSKEENLRATTARYLSFVRLRYFLNYKHALSAGSAESSTLVYGGAAVRAVQKGWLWGKSSALAVQRFRGENGR